MIKFSICIPNYNYDQYIGQTIQSVLDQDYGDFEILIADNKSTDNSWEVIQHYAANDSRIKAWQNAANLGFAGNLDAVSSQAIGDYHLLVSSDDMMNPGALAFYARFLESIGDAKAAFSSSTMRIDAESKPIGSDGARNALWKKTDLDHALSEQFRCNIYKVASGEMLKRCLLSFYGPFNFVSTCYRAIEYHCAGGYGGSRMYNPDKWLHWRLLVHTDFVYFIDQPLFSYRWHSANQAALQMESGALKYLMDEYRSSFEVDKPMLEKAGIGANEIKASFIYNIIQKNTFSFIKQGQLTMARRIYNFGWAAYPQEMRKSKYTWLLCPLLKMGKMSKLLIRPFKKNYSIVE